MKIFTKNDLNGFWALFSDNLANMVIISGVCKFIFKMPNEIVYGRILPGIGISLIFGLSYYAYLAYKLRIKEGRMDVTALPYGISTPVMFVYLFSIIGPIYWKTNDSILSWQIGISAAFIGGIVEASGALIGPFLKKNTPRVAMLGTLAGIAIVWISTVPMAIIFESPIIGFASFVILFSGLVAGIRLPFRMPAGFLAIIVGTIIGFIKGDSSFSFEGTGFYPPFPVIKDLIIGIKFLLKNPELFSIIIPIEIYNFIETMNNVESAEAAGDKYDVRSCQLMDGFGTMVGALFGSPFPTTVYIGHPAYKRLGSRIGYAIGVGIVFFIGSIFGMVAFLHHLVPEAAVAPMLVFIGVVIISQAFRSVDSKYAIAAGMAIIPHIADIIVKKVSGAVQQTGKFLLQLEQCNCVKLNEYLNKISAINFPNELISDWLKGQGIHFYGKSALSQGAIITGLIWGAVTAYLIDFKLMNAFFFTLSAAFLTLFGFIHSPVIKFNTSPIFYGYLIFSALLLMAYLLKIKKDPDIEAFKY
jgi:AGZA family xanthine/uracil permease-like MFS transporter